jgi:nucleotide-binding universal stress UspA family protein
MSEPEWRDATDAEGHDLAEDPEGGTDPGSGTTLAASRRLVVVGLDFSATARRALAWALEHAAATGAVLHAVHVIDRRWRASDLAADAGALTRELTEVERAAAAELAALTAEARGRVGAVHEHVTIGRPAEELVRMARELGAHEIVVGSHGHDAVTHLLLGSVAERVARSAPCTVVVVR